MKELDKTKDFETEFAAMLEQVAASTEEINGTMTAQSHNIGVIKHNIGESNLELKELAQSAKDNVNTAKEAFSDMNKKLEEVQNASAIFMSQSAKAEKQKPMFSAIEKMIDLVITSLVDIQDDVMGPLHVLAVNGAIQANRYRAGGTGGLSGVLNKVSENTSEIKNEVDKKIKMLISTLKPYIEIAKRLSVSNEEFFVYAKNASQKMGKIYDSFDELRIYGDAFTTEFINLQEKTERLSNHLDVIDGMTNEFASSVTQTNEAIKEIQDSVVAVTREFNEHKEVTG